MSLSGTYQSQLIKFKQSLVHSRLVYFELLFFLAKAPLEVPVPLSIL